MSEQFSVRWHDFGRDPQIAADPNYPDGVDIDLAHGQEPSCKLDLEHPTKRCGIWLIVCRRCNGRVGLTTAGRDDDPRSVTIPCRVD